MTVKLSAVIESSNKVKNFILNTPLNSDVKDEMDFLFNSIERISQLLAAYEKVEPHNTIAKIIILRPLILDSMLFLLLGYYAQKHMWDEINAVLTDCLAEGVLRQFHTFKEMFEIENMSKIKKNVFLNEYLTEFKRFFAEESTIHNPKLKPKHMNFEITPEHIKKKLIETEYYINFKNIEHLYQTMSKFEHNTLVSLKLSKKYNFELISYNQSESTVFFGYLNLLKYIALGYLHRDNNTCELILDEYTKLKSLKD